MKVNQFLSKFPSFDESETGSGGGTPVDPKTSFSKEEVEQLIQGRVSGIEKQLLESKNELDSLKKGSNSDELKSLISSMKEEIEELKSGKVPNPDKPLPDDYQGQIDLLSSRHKKELLNIQEQLSQEKSIREAEEKKRMNIEKEREIYQGLQDAGCRKDAESIGLSHFQGQVIFDDEDEKWVFKRKNGGTVSIADGIQEELPDFLKEPASSRGGSGSRSGTKKEAARKELDELEKQLDKQRQLGRSGKSAEILKYQRLKREVEKKRNEIESS